MISTPNRVLRSSRIEVSTHTATLPVLRPVLPLAPLSRPARSSVKRAIDIVGASSLLLLTLPMLVIAFVLVKLSKPDASGFYLQKRIGGGARPFMMWKLRTMVADAEHSAVELHRVSGRVFLNPLCQRGVRRWRLDNY